jgi:hypothetical protein
MPADDSSTHEHGERGPTEAAAQPPEAQASAKRRSPVIWSSPATELSLAGGTKHYLPGAHMLCTRAQQR